MDQDGDPILLCDIQFQTKVVKYMSPKYCRYLVNFAIFCDEFSARKVQISTLYIYCFFQSNSIEGFYRIKLPYQYFDGFYSAYLIIAIINFALIFK